nr:MAG TPA: hypothetical protein [Bacteriophage sp.]
MPSYPKPQKQANQPVRPRLDPGGMGCDQACAPGLGVLLWLTVAICYGAD